MSIIRRYTVVNDNLHLERARSVGGNWEERHGVIDDREEFRERQISDDRNRENAGERYW